jgi:hypothetical protein
LVREELFEAVERAAATQRIQHEPQHDGARVHVHLCGHVVIDETDEASLVGIGLLMGRGWTGYTSISGGMSGMAHSHGSRWPLDATWGLQSSHGDGLFEARRPSEKMRLIRSLRGAECGAMMMLGYFDLACLTLEVGSTLARDNLTARLAGAGLPLERRRAVRSKCSAAWSIVTQP